MNNETTFQPADLITTDNLTPLPEGLQVTGTIDLSDMPVLPPFNA